MLNKKIIALIILSLLLIGCRTSPVLEITDAPLTTGSGKTPAISAVTHDIIQAGIGLGWQMKKVKPGHIIGTLILRKHMVKTDIYYSSTEYSIVYKDSSEMNYNSDTATVHANYNSWVQNLSNAIRTHVFNNNN